MIWFPRFIEKTPILFKDKLNFKMPGGAGFIAIRALLLTQQESGQHHVSAMVAIDGATVENGCLQVAPGLHNDELFEKLKRGHL